MIKKTRHTTSIQSPFFSTINNLKYSNFGIQSIQINSLFMSLSRIFLYYHRIIEPLHNNKVIIRPYIESDLENFIIRERIILNDIAYIIRKVLPKNLRGLKNPRGERHELNREMRIKDIMKYVEKNDISGLHKILKKNKSWITELEDQRNDIIHYKSHVVLFDTKPDISFAILNAAGTEKREKTKKGERVIMTPLFEHVNSQTKSLWDFINIDIKNWIEKYAVDNDIKMSKITLDTSMSSIGVPLFKKINKIKNTLE
jgi:hypothetical protein